jgi:hypothetical protein
MAWSDEARRAALEVRRGRARAKKAADSAAGMSDAQWRKNASKIWGAIDRSKPRDRIIAGRRSPSTIKWKPRLAKVNRLTRSAMRNEDLREYTGPDLQRRYGLDPAQGRLLYRRIQRQYRR